MRLLALMLSDMQLLRSLQGLFKTQPLGKADIGELLDLAPNLLADNNSKVIILPHADAPSVLCAL